METSNEIKHQKAQRAKSDGVQKTFPVSNTRPSIRRIVVQDLKRFDRLHELYQQAVQAGWLTGSEANALNFVGAAVRAREVEGDAPRVFASIVRRGLWQNITQAQEEKARKALVNFRQNNPAWFKP